MLHILLLAWLIGECDAPRMCSCFPPPEPETPAEARDYVEGAAAVFEGTVVRVTRATPAEVRQDLPRADLLAVTLRVKRQWRGAVSDSIVVTTSSHASMCGVDFEEGREYFVIADAVEADQRPAWVAAPWLSARSCGRTRPAQRARKLERLLGSQ